MYQIDGNKMSTDYKKLCEKRDYHLAIVEQAAKTFASTRGYDEAKTAKFIECVKGLENDGLTADEHAKLEFLGGYISVVPDATTPANQ